MARYRIYAGIIQQHTVEAKDSEAAIKIWLNGPGGYDSIEHAANEFFCDPSQIKARLLPAAETF